MANVAEPKSMVAPPNQPIGWPTHRFQHSLRTVMPSNATGMNMTMHKNIPKELLPNARYDKLPERWRWKADVLPPLINKNRVGHHKEPHGQYKTTTSWSVHEDMRPPSACSSTFILRPDKTSTWTVDQKLDSARLRHLMRKNTFLPGNFSTLYKCPKEKVKDMVNRLSYNPYERREQLILTDNAENADTPLYNKTDIDAIVERLAAVKPPPEEEPESEKKQPCKELSAKEKEIVDRLSKYEHPADKIVEETEENKKTVTKAELEAMLKRLTQTKERKVEKLAVQPAEARKVSAVDLDTILNRLTTYDSQKWPPESKPEIFRLHTKDD